MNPDSHHETSGSSDPSPDSEPAGPRETGRIGRGIRLFLAACLVAAVAYLGWRRTGPEPPRPNWQGLDPAVVDVLQACERAVRRQPRSGHAWGKLGMALLVYEFTPEARTCLAHAERFDPTDSRWAYFHGVSLFPDQTEAGLDRLRCAVELTRDENSAARLRLANILAEFGRYDEAEEHYRAVLAKWPDDPGAILGLGRLTFARGNFAESLDYLNRAANSPFTARLAHQLLITVHNRLGDAEMSAQLQNKLGQLPADRSLPDAFVDEASQLRVGLRALVDYGALLAQQGDLDEAKPLAQRAVQEYPTSPEAWMLMTRIYLAEQRLDDAVKAAEKAVELSPSTVEPRMQLGVTLLHRRQIEDAIRCFQRAVELKPELGEAHHNLGLCFSARQAWPDAIQSFREAIRLNSGFVDSYLGLADALARNGDMAGARDAIQSALRLRPEDPRAHQIIDIHGLRQERPQK